MEGKTIYIFYHCDIWKSTDSMGLITATTSLRKLKGILTRHIKEDKIRYIRGNTKLSRTKQVKLFREDFADYGESFVFNAIEFGYVKSITDGEE